MLDETGLAGVFDINLQWMSDETQEPSNFSAFQEPGLKLDARKAPVEILVIDHCGETFPELISIQPFEPPPRVFRDQRVRRSREPFERRPELL